MSASRKLLLAACTALALVAGAPAQSTASMPSFDGATGWINSPPIAAEALRGKVVLVDFWTYSCINCLRTLPYVKAWAQRYGPHGLVVVGVHTPEFDFERSAANVLRATRELGISYPVAVDSRGAVWQAFGTRAWPTLVFVDAQGQVRETQLGEGRYDEAERLIQRLLREAGHGAGLPGDLVAPQAIGTQAAAAAARAVSEETYLGSARADVLRAWTLAGRWRSEAEWIEAAQPGARLRLRFRARDLHLVMGPAAGGDTRPLRFRLTVDGKPPGADHGSDVAPDGSGVVDGHRLYQLVRQVSGRADERQFEIEFLDPGVRAYAFTFG